MYKSVLTLATVAVLGASVVMAGGTLDRIKADGKVTVATEAAFKPFEYVEDGKIVGFGSDLLVEVIKDLGVEVEQLDIPFQGILAGLAAGQYDIVATSVAINPDRAKVYAFSRPFGSISNVIMVPVDNDAIGAPGDLNGLLVATQLGSSTETEARQMDADLKSAGGSGFTDLRLFQTFPDTAFALRSGQVDAILISSMSAGAFIADSPGTFKVAAHFGDPVLLSWVVRPEDKDLLASLDGTITRLSDSGDLAKMQEKWLGLASDSPASGYLPEGAIQLQ